MAPNLNDLENQTNSVDGSVTSVAKALRSLKNKPLKNGIIRAIGLLVVFFNTASVQYYIDALNGFGLNLSVNIKQFNPGYSLVWLGLIVLLFIIAVIKRKNELKTDVGAAGRPSSDSPIKGLWAFDFGDTEVFNNLERHHEIGIYKNALLAQKFRFGILMGVSGAGKTSLVKAGLTPAITKASNSACLVITVSQKNPVNSVIEAIREQYNQPDLLTNVDLPAVLDQLPVVKTNGKLVLIFDQFEQFFTQNPMAEDRVAFIEQLNTVYESDRDVRILLSIRADFSGYLIEIMQKLNYTLTASFNYFQLDKFNTAQVVKIIKYVAEVEKIPAERIDDDFIEKLAKNELADPDGKVSAVNIQILLWIMKGKRNEDGLNFTQAAFNKLGGMEGMLQSFLETELATPNLFNSENEALHCLLALIDLNTNLRAGQIPLSELPGRLPGTFNKANLLTVLNWLEILRLVNRVSAPNNVISYELAHERLVEPIRNIDNKSGGESRKATRLLEKRTKEWLDNERSRRYYLPFTELRYILKNKQLITLGSNSEIKNLYINKSYKYIFNWALGFTALFSVMALYFLFTTTTYYKLEIKAKNDIENKLTVNKNTYTANVYLLDSLYTIDSAFVKDYCLSGKNEELEYKFIYFALTRPNPPLNELIQLSTSFKVTDNQVYALLAISKAFYNRGQKQIAYNLNKLALEKFLKNPYENWASLLATVFEQNDVAAHDKLVTYIRTKDGSLSNLMQLYDAANKTHPAEASRYLNEALGKINIDALSSDSVSNYLPVFSAITKLDENKARLYYDKLITKVLTTERREQIKAYKDVNLLSIIKNLISQTPADFKILSMSLVDKIVDPDYKNDAITIIINYLNYSDFNVVEKYYQLLLVMALKQKVTERIPYLITIYSDLYDRNTAFAKTIETQLNIAINEIPNQTLRKTYANELKDAITRTEPANRNKNNVKYYAKEFFLTANRADSYNINNVNYEEWVDSLVKKDIHFRDKVYKSIISGIGVMEDSSRKFIAIKGLIGLYDKLKPSEQIAKKILALGESANTNTMLFTYIKTQSIYPALVKNKTQFVDSVYKRTKVNLFHEYTYDKGEAAEYLSAWFLASNNFRQALNILEAAETHYTDVKNDIESDDSFVFYKLRLMINYQKRKNHWRNLFW